MCRGTLHTSEYSLFENTRLSDKKFQGMNNLAYFGKIAVRDWILAANETNGQVYWRLELFTAVKSFYYRSLLVDKMSVVKIIVDKMTVDKITIV